LRTKYQLDILANMKMLGLKPVDILLHPM